MSEPQAVEDDENSKNLQAIINESCYNNNKGNNPTTTTTTTSYPVGLVDRESLMMMDLDLDLDGSSWIFDQISTDPTSPFLLSDHPFSPIWPFSDDNNDVSGPVTGGSIAVSPSCKSYIYSLLYFCYCVCVIHSITYVS